MADGSGNEQWKNTLEDPSYRNMDADAKFDCIMAAMRENPKTFLMFYGIHPKMFDRLLKYIRKFKLLEPHRSDLNLSIALRYFSSGDSDNYYSGLFGVSKLQRVKIVIDICNAIISTLGRKVYIKPTHEHLVENAVSFDYLWNFPNCAGAVDGRRILCQRPESDGFTFYSLPIVFICDAYLRFNEIYFGFFTRKRAERELLLSRYYKVLKKTRLESNEKMKGFFNLVLVGRLKGKGTKHIMQAFNDNSLDEKEVIFNYRHNRAKAVVDTALGILFKRWKIFQLPFVGDPVRVTKILQCLTVLHNWLVNKELCLSPSKKKYMPVDVLQDRQKGYLLEGHWGQYSITKGVRPFHSNKRRARMGLHGDIIRRKYVGYFSLEGVIPGRDVLKPTKLETLVENEDCTEPTRTVLRMSSPKRYQPTL